MYIARCSDGTLYVGIAQDVVARLALHDSGRGARYTRGRGPLRLLAKRRCASKGDALRLEHAIKRLARREKLRVAASPHRLAALARSLVRGGVVLGNRNALDTVAKRGQGKPMGDVTFGRL